MTGWEEGKRYGGWGEEKGETFMHIVKIKYASMHFRIWHFLHKQKTCHEMQNKSTRWPLNDIQKKRKKKKISKEGTVNLFPEEVVGG